MLSGDSGTFGSQATMNRIQKMQSQPKSMAPRPTRSGNKMFKAQLTGKAPWDPFSNKLTR